MTFKKHIFSALAYFLITTLNGQIASSAIETCPIKNGESIPEATLTTINGDEVRFSEILDAKPSVIIFYRGSWCPYCNRQLATLQTIEDDLIDLGYKIIAISPDTPDNLQKTIDQNELKYTLVSDNKIELTGKMGLAYVDPKNRTLPVPAVYLVDANGVIQFNYVNPNYKVRLDSELLIKAAELMIKGD